MIIQQVYESATVTASFRCVSAVAHRIIRFNRVLSDRIGLKVCILFAIATGFLLILVRFNHDPTGTMPREMSSTATPRNLKPSTESTSSPSHYSSEAYSLEQSFVKLSSPDQGISHGDSADTAFTVPSQRTNSGRPITSKLDYVQTDVAKYYSTASSPAGHNLEVLSSEKREHKNSTLVASSGTCKASALHINANHSPKTLPGWKVTSACAYGLRVLYFVHTAPQHHDRRRFLRKTIGSPEISALLNSSLVFFVGTTTDKKLKDEVYVESDNEGDLVELDFLDTYRNLTLKFIGATNWLSANGCLNTAERVVVKLDDDVIVNVFLLASYIRYIEAMGATSSPNIFCAAKKVLAPIRKKPSKWFVSKQEYSTDKYPPYCAGAAYIMPAPVLLLLGQVASHVPFFWIDDVYATGLVARAANVSLIDITQHYRISPSEHTRAVGRSTMFFHWGQSPALFRRARQLWMSVVNQKYHV